MNLVEFGKLFGTISLASILGIYLSWWNYRRLQRKDLKEELKAEIDLQQATHQAIADIEQFTEKLKEFTAQINAMKTELTAQQMRINDLHNVTQNVQSANDKHNDQIRELYGMVQQQAIAGQVLLTSTENLLKTVSELSNRSMINSERIAEIKGKIGN